MRLPRPFHSIKLRIVAVVVATGVLTAVGTSTLLLRSVDEHLRSRLLRSDHEESERTAELLAGKLETLKQALTEVARRIPETAWNDQPAMERYLLDKPALQGLFNVVLIAAADGRMLARVEKGEASVQLPNIGDREYFQRAMRTDQPVISEPLIGRVNTRPLVIIAIPVPGRSGNTIGILGGAVQLGSNSLFADSLVRGRYDGTTTLVIDRRGVILSHPDASRLLGKAADEASLKQVYAAWHDAGSPIDTIGNTSLSHGYLVSIAGIPLSDWVLLRVTPQALALQPVTDAQHSAWIAALIAGALSALLAGGVAWHMTRPISRLQSAAERLLDEGADAAVTWPTDRGEFGALACAFQQLLAQRHARQAELSTLLVTVQAVLDNADVGIALSRDGRFEMVSQRLCQCLQISREDLVGQPTRRMHPSDEAYKAFSQRTEPEFLSTGGFEGEVELVRGSGEAFWARMRGRAITSGDRSAGTIWVIEDVTELRGQREKLAWAASHDALTGLPNRAAFEEALEAAVKAAPGQPCCALFIDLDRFKQVNDTAGHAAGDALLCGVAQALAASLRKTDTVARLGGDEFAVLLPHCPITQGRQIAEKLRAAVERYSLAWEGASFGVGASVGLVAVADTHGSAAEVLREADAACYAAKREGRNRVSTLIHAV